METKVNLVLLAILGVAWGAVSLAEPAAALDPQASSTNELAQLEDAFAADRGNAGLAARLADHYVDLRSPQLAVAALGASTPEVRRDPAILHRLAQAYEETGRVEDALGTARLALARCARAIGTSRASELTPVPTHDCTERTYAALDMHASALAHMVRWGVTDPQTDRRTPTAYALAVRSARILSASAE